MMFNSITVLWIQKDFMLSQFEVVQALWYHVYHVFVFVVFLKSHSLFPFNYLCQLVKFEHSVTNVQFPYVFLTFRKPFNMMSIVCWECWKQDKKLPSQLQLTLQLPAHSSFPCQRVTISALFAGIFGIT